MTVGGAPAGRLAAARGLTLRQGVRLAAWKALAKGRETADRAGGLRRAAREADRWGAQWLARWGGPDGAGATPMRRWLDRPGAGRLWIAPAEAAAWAASTCTPADLALADAAAANLVDLLGSGPVDVGAESTFRLDLYTRREWPLVPAGAVRLARGDGSDVRTLWEQSRFYEVLPLARAWRATGEPRYRDAFVRRARAWMRHNPVGMGPNWATPMDLAIRSANWALACVLLADDADVPADFWAALLANLRLTARWVSRHLEWHPVWRGNHFVSNAVGLVYVGALFADDRAGAGWLRDGGRMLHREIAYQVSADGVGFEASLAYHRLDAELFGWAAEVLRRNPAAGLSAEYDERLRAMFAFIDAYLPPSGLAPMIGDADDGRLHAVSAEGMREPRAHRLGLPDGHWPARAAEADAGDPRASRAFPGGGFYALRAGDGHCVVRCGPVGLNGAGSHDHNDQLSFELVLAGRRVVADSGTYAYTRDLAERHRFRATAAHNAVQLGDDEQNPISPQRPWRVLADRARAECTRWDADAERVVFEGRHRGFAHRASGAVVSRRITGSRDGRWRVEDEVAGSGTEPLTWRLHLGPDVAAAPRALGGGRHELVLGGAPAVRAVVELPPGLELSVEQSYLSDRYGERAPRACLVARGAAALPARLTLTFTGDRA